MDEFLKEIYVAVFKKWLTFQKSEEYIISEETSPEEAIVLTSDVTIGKIVFHDQCVMELSVTNKKTDQIEYYLHFRMQTLKHAVCLFREMVSTMSTFNEQKTVKVLLSCTSGLTTGFFADQLNTAAKAMHKDYSFEAVAYNELANVGTDYNIILLAPQISYQEARVRSIFDRTPVTTIPSIAFAKYDCDAVFKLIEKTLFEDESKKESVNLPGVLRLSINHPDQILAIGIIKTAHHVHLHYRVYEKQNILTYGDIIKHAIALVDFNDIINMALMKCPHIKHVAIAAPGIMARGHMTLLGHGFDHVDVVGYLKGLHPSLTFSLDNDVNAIVSGLYALQDNVDSLSFMFLPRGSYVGGVGSIYKGQLIKGLKNVAGEVQYMPIAYSDDPEKLGKSEEGSKEILAKTLAGVISVLGPEEIAYYCSNVPCEDELYHAIKNYVPEEYIPPIKKIENLKEYILFGEMIQIIMRLENAPKN